jgi:hypothetical protein
MAGVVERALLAEGVVLKLGVTVERVEGREGRIRRPSTPAGRRR